MFKIVAAPDVQKKLNNLKENYPVEVCEEVRHFIGILKREGNVRGTNFYDINTNEISGLTCKIFFRIYPEQKTVSILDIKTKIIDVFKQRFKVENEWNDEDMVEIIPQCDKPQKLIKTIELIHQGITNSYQIGCELGNQGKRKEYISRHGQYAKHALKALKLIIDEHYGKKKLIQLTDKGKLIAEANNFDLQSRLLIESMLNYPPIWRIIDAVSLKESKLNNSLVLSDEVIKRIAFPEELHGSDTSNRRSQTLKSWIKWISKYSGIPIRLNEEAVQLSIPMLYSQNLQADSK